MYISNSSNIGMATLLQNNKNCMKTLTNGTSVVGVGTAGTNHIIVGNVVNAQAVGQQQQLQTNHHQVGIVNSTNVPTQTIATSTQGGLGSGTNTITTLSGNFVLPAQTQTILLTNGATGASTILTYQQYQQLLQQQQQQQQQRLLVSQNLVNLPIGNLISTGNGGLAVITDNSNNHNVATSGSTSTTQGTLLVASSSAASTTATSSFQQQFQQQLANLQNNNNTSSSTTTPTTQTAYLQQQTSNQQQRLITTSSSVAAVASPATASNAKNNSTAPIRHFSQFSQQQPANIINTPNSNTNNLNNQPQRTTTVLINRNKNTIIAGNTTQRLQHATILKSPANIIKTTQQQTQQQQQPTLMVNNMAVQQVINSSNGQIISLVKTSQPQQINKNFVNKTKQQTTTANLPQQQKPQLQRYGNNTIQQIKQQQLKIVTASTTNLQTVPQRATIINSNTITKNHVVISNSISNKSISNNTTKIVNLAKTTTSTTSIANNNTNITSISNNNNSSNSQMNGHFKSLQQQPASKLVPNGHNNNTSISSSNINYNTNRSFTHNSNTSSASSIASASSVTTNPNTTSSMHTISTNSQIIPTSKLIKNTNSTLITSNPSSSTTTSTTDKNHISANTTANNCDSNSTATTTNTTTTTTTTTTAPASQELAGPGASEQQESEPEIDIVINNVVCSFSVRCHLNLREIALNGANVEYRRENGMVTMKLRRPYTTASIWSSGRITCTGATSEEQAKIAARRYARCLEKLGFRVRFNNFRVVNVLGTCSMPWAIKIVNFSEKYRDAASYEPELHPGVTYKLRFPKATLKIFSTGSITVTAASVANVQSAIEHIFPLVYEFRKKRSPEELEQLRLKQQQHATFENITEVDDVVAGTGTEIGIMPANNLQRRRISTTLNKLPNNKRKRFDNDIAGELDDVDDPDCIAGDADEDDMVMYDPNESIIEGPEDEDEDL